MPIGFVHMCVQNIWTVLVASGTTIQIHSNGFVGGHYVRCLAMLMRQFLHHVIIRASHIQYVQCTCTLNSGRNDCNFRSADWSRSTWLVSKGSCNINLNLVTYVAYMYIICLNALVLTPCGRCLIMDPGQCGVFILPSGQLSGSPCRTQVLAIRDFATTCTCTCQHY